MIYSSASVLEEGNVAMCLRDDLPETLESLHISQNQPFHSPFTASKSMNDIVKYTLIPVCPKLDCRDQRATVCDLSQKSPLSKERVQSPAFPFRIKVKSSQMWPTETFPASNMTKCLLVLHLLQWVLHEWERKEGLTLSSGRLIHSAI